MTSSEYHTIEFPLITGLKPQQITFLPFGTRTIKIKVTNPDYVPDNLVLRSDHVPVKFGTTSFFSHEENGTDFQVSWGGGHEEGSCVSGQDQVKTVAGKEFKIPFEECGPLLSKPHSFVYLNITHTKGDFSKPRTLLLTVRPEGKPISPPLFSLPLVLNPPKIQNPVKLVQVNSTRYEFEGTDIPEYISRWWSVDAISYLPSRPDVPNLVLNKGKDVLQIQMKKDDQLITLVDYVNAVQFQGLEESHSIDLDLYHFVDHYYVVRLWFFWLWKSGMKTWGHEIPDAERFDFVIDTKTAKVVYAATDTHWRESWTSGPEDNKPVKAQIGLFSTEVIGTMTIKDSENLDSYISWMLSHKAGPEEERPHNPADVVRRSLAPDMPFYTVLGAGVEAHVPYFVNCPPPQNDQFIGSDPRNG